MRRASRLTAALAVASLAALLSAPAALGFGLDFLETRVIEENGEPATLAGSHPFALETEFEVQTEEDPELGEIPAGQLRDLSGALPTGLTGSPYAADQCEAVDFVTVIEVANIKSPNCPNSAVLGKIEADLALANGAPVTIEAAVYNLVPSPGVAAKIGFRFYEAGPVTIDVGIEDTPPYNATFAVTNTTQSLRVLGGRLEVWGDPSDEAHDEERGTCGLVLEKGGVRLEAPGSCPVSDTDKPFLTLPRSCGGPLATSFRALSWTGDVFEQTVFSPPMTECAALGFSPEISSQPTTDQAESPSGLDFGLDIKDEGLTSPSGRAHSDIKKAVVTLPEGMTINPSQAEGLGVCSEAGFAREKAGSEFGAGCPAASKIGTTEVETPLLEGKILKGTLFVAEPYRNPFGTLIALYMTFKEPSLGIGIKLAGKVEPDPASGQLIASFDDLPQQPFSHFRLRFREGGRSPLITPPTCGRYTTEATFTPWANPAAPYETSASFEISGGVGGGPCSSGAQPFEPGFAAGTLNNDAGAYSPFHMALTRRDGDQDLTRFAAKLPQGMLAKLAGVGRCPDAQIALAKAKSGRAELASPSCPLNSLIGGADAGAGVGSQLTYVKGRIYLAGPYNGAPLSVVAIVPAVAGPFDVGTVITRVALRVDPRSGEVQVDGERSDPIPHILAGIPLRVRDIRVDVDRSAFTLNPTSCEPAAIGAMIWGGGANPFSALDDIPVARQARFQAAGCRALGFKPRLALRLKGGTRRGANPALRAVLRPRPGDANLQNAVVRLPRSAFLDQGHIRTICTRVQFAADSCPKGAIYGRVKAFTPLLDEPLQGPVYLRSSNNNLPDLVFDLRGLVDFEAVGRIDSKRGGIRTTFTRVPDAPISRVVLNMQGGKKGLIVNSTNLCAKKRRAAVRLDAHNGRRHKIHPVLHAAACKRAKRSRARHSRG